MAALTVSLIGLNRTSASIGLALKRYMTKGGKNRFEIIGHDYDTANEKDAHKMGAIDRSDHDLARAVESADLVVLALSYEDVRESFRQLAGVMRPGVVVLDASPLKQPSLKWAGEFFSDEQHLVGISPIINPRYLFKQDESLNEASEDLFDDSAILLTPAVQCAQDAIDLAFSFCTILGSKPRFLDPQEHDAMLAMTDGLPRLLSVALFQTLVLNRTWGDIQWFTNPDFGALTYPLYNTHPDALRDEFVLNRDALARGLDQIIATLSQYRELLADNDAAAIEAALVTTSQEYEVWLNRRHKANWDEAAKLPKVDASQTLVGSLFGSAIAKRLQRNRDEDSDKNGR